MPSVEMRRSTRVFVPKTKDGDGVRVLRSGRRLWGDPGVGKLKVSASGGVRKECDGWFSLIDTSSNEDLVRLMETGLRETLEPKESVESQMEVDGDKSVPELVMRAPAELPEVVSEGKKFRNVYSRKRKRSNSGDSRLSFNSGGKSCKNDKKFGLHFIRQRRKFGKRSDLSSLNGLTQPHAIVEAVDRGAADHELLSVAVESGMARSCHLTEFLSSILRHMTRTELGLKELSAFLLSQPIGDVFNSCGIRLLPYQDRACAKTSGCCKIFGARQFIPLFTVQFSVVPLTFMLMHASLYFGNFRQSSLLVYNLPETPGGSEKGSEDEGVETAYLQIKSVAPETTMFSGTTSLAPENDKVCALKVENQSLGLVCALKAENPSLGLSKLASRNSPYRNGVMTRGVQKRQRRSLRSRRARRNPSVLGLNKTNGVLLSDLLGTRRIASPVPSRAIKRERKRASRKSSCNDPKILKSALCDANGDVESLCCSANILVVEAEKCFRVKGAVVRLEKRTGDGWILAVKKDGLMFYFLRAQKEMKPITTNRFTHALVWASDNGWKLEFLERKDWVIFKELYKVCAERTIPAPGPPPAEKFIPVPRIQELSGCGDASKVPFIRPETYIKTNDDELSRALLRRTAIYDMDSEDEEWLHDFNRELYTVNGPADILSEETFELMIDAFEKAVFCRPEDYTDEQAAAKLCVDLARREVVEAVFSFWIKRRKQKRNPLIMVFQLNQPKRTQMITKPVLRKKRSLKRQISQIQGGRGKDRNVLQAMAAKHNAVEEQNAMVKVQEAKAAAKRTLELAIKKRQRAQLFMEKADLATYRATMALKIAETAQVAESNDMFAHFLDD